MKQHREAGGAFRGICGTLGYTIIATVTIPVWGLTGCVPNDMPYQKIEIRENSLEITDLRDRPESALWPGSTATSPQPMGMITFSSDSNLREISERTGFDFGTYMYLCNNTDPTSSGAMRNDVYIYDSLGRISPYPDGKLSSNKIKTTSPFTYRVYFFLNGPKKESIYAKEKPSSMYDLEMVPEDICLWIEGPGEAEGLPISNVIAISADQVREALRHSAPSLSPKP